MSTALQTLNLTGLSTSLKKMARTASTASAFLKMEKTGDWVFGVNAEEVPEDMELAVHPGLFGHGYVAWEADNGGTKLGEVMGPLNEELPATGPVPDGADGWQFQLGLGLMAVEDRTPMIFRTTSVGGKRAIAAIGGEIAAKLDEGDAQCVPIVTLSSESYKHKKYGKIFNPIITATRWVGMEFFAEPVAETVAKVPAKANGKAKPPVKAKAPLARKAA
jgi:hypothetical protein